MTDYDQLSEGTLRVNQLATLLRGLAARGPHPLKTADKAISAAECDALLCVLCAGAAHLAEAGDPKDPAQDANFSEAQLLLAGIRWTMEICERECDGMPLAVADFLVLSLQMAAELLGQVRAAAEVATA